MLLIYVVDDDAVVKHTLLEFLTELGHSALPIHSTDDLLRNLGTNHQDSIVVIAKLEMMGGDHASFLRELHDRHPGAAFILITNACGGFSATEALSSGVYAFLRQPIRLSELELSLTRLLESRLANR